jgi:aminopeptidase N
MVHVPDRLGREEAHARAEQIADLSYAISLDLSAGAKSFTGDVSIAFTHRGGDTFLEWVGGHIELLEVNGATVEPDWDGARITLSAGDLQDRNVVRVVYERPYGHTGEGFHRFLDPEDGAEYLYTQFEPYSAHRVFPCFDQPDLKAAYRIVITAPADWEVVTAAPEERREPADGDRLRRVFAATPPFSTYLLAVCAGPYFSVGDEHRGIPLRILCRASLAEHLDAAPLFELTKVGIDFYSNLFAEPYPFAKYDQIFVPEFNWGGMENVAAVTYTDSVVFRDPPTGDQLTRRAEYLMHELAHMWFGDLVTLRWWNDLWLNESFASFVAYLALDHIGGYGSIWQDFHHRMKLWAYREDQRPTTHRIADDVESTDETFLNFDGITYGKGAAVLRQLVAAIGDDAFRSGMQTYFRRHRFGNATLADFLAALQEGSGLDLIEWAARWLRTASLNSLAADWRTEGGRLTALELVQSAPEDHPVLRPHRVDVALVSDDGSVRSVPASIDDVRASVPAAVGEPAPVFVFPNHRDLGYAKVVLDEGSVSWARAHIGMLDDALLRQQVWASLWEMVRDRLMPSQDYLALVCDTLRREQDLTIVRLVAAAAATALARYTPEDRIDDETHRFVAAARRAIDGSPPGDARVVWARALVGAARSEEDVRLATALVDVPPDGLAVDQDMRWVTAIRWAALGLPGSEERLASQRARDPSDRGDRALAAAEAARPDPAAKEDAWARIHEGGYASLRLAIAAMGTFWQRSQRAMLEPFVPRFFAALPDVFSDWEHEAARAYFTNLFPWHRIEPSTRDLVGGLGERGDAGPVLRRLAIEAGDDLDRALACRELAARSGPSAADLVE